MNREEFYEAVAKELSSRGETFWYADLYGFVTACWPTDSSPEEVADDWQTAQKEKEYPA